MASASHSPRPSGREPRRAIFTKPFQWFLDHLAAVPALSEAKYGDDYRFVWQERVGALILLKSLKRFQVIIGTAAPDLKVGVNESG